METLSTCAMFLERKIISSSLTHCHAFASKENEKPAHKRQQAFLASIEPKHRISDAVLKQIAAVHNSMVGHWGLQKCREFLNDPTIMDRTINQFIRQCPCCQVMSRLNILIMTHSFTCASYNPFESLHIDHIGPLTPDVKGNTHILVMIDAFSRWVELFPTKTTGASEAASCFFPALWSLRNTRCHSYRPGSGLSQRTLLRVSTSVCG